VTWLGFFRLDLCVFNNFLGSFRNFCFLCTAFDASEVFVRGGVIFFVFVGRAGHDCDGVLQIEAHIDCSSLSAGRRVEGGERM